MEQPGIDARRDQEHNLETKPDALRGADRNGVIEEKPRNHHDHKPEHHWPVEMRCKLPGRKSLESPTEHPQINDHKQSKEQRQRQDVGGLNPGIHVDRLMQRNAPRLRRKIFRQSEQAVVQHQDTALHTGIITPPTGQATVRSCR